MSSGDRRVNPSPPPDTRRRASSVSGTWLPQGLPARGGPFRRDFLSRNPPYRRPSRKQDSSRDRGLRRSAAALRQAPPRATQVPHRWQSRSNRHSSGLTGSPSGPSPSCVCTQKNTGVGGVIDHSDTACRSSQYISFRRMCRQLGLSFTVSSSCMSQPPHCVPRLGGSPDRRPPVTEPPWRRCR